MQWLLNKTRYEYLQRKANGTLGAYQACIEKGQARKGKAYSYKCKKRFERMDKSYESLVKRTEKLSVHGPLADWVYLFSPVSLALLLIFSEHLSQIISDPLMGASAILPLGFLFMNMFFEKQTTCIDTQFLGDAVVDIHVMEQHLEHLEHSIEEYT